MTRPGDAAVWWLGLVQCGLWGVLYYGFAVWQLPLQASSNLPSSGLAGAYSAALLLAALLAPKVGRGFDRGLGPTLFRIGVGAAVAGLVLLASAPSTPAVFAAWLGIGLGMAFTLYESAFALVHRAIADPDRRLRGLAAVTVVGGLASTVFLPLLGGLAGAFGLRASLLGGAVAVLLAGWLFERCVLPALAAAAPTINTQSAPAAQRRGGITAMAAVFASGTVAGMALVTLLVPLLVSRGAGLAAAAMVLGALGLAQLPGRLWLMWGGRMPSPVSLTVWPMFLQATGLVVAAMAASVGVAAVGVALFGLGAGLHTLARPWLVQQRFGPGAGHRNGQVALAQGVGRALTPVAAVLAGGLVGPSWVLGGLALAVLALTPLARRVAAEGQASPDRFRLRLIRSSMTEVSRAPVKNTSAA